MSEATRRAALKTAAALAVTTGTSAPGHAETGGSTLTFPELKHGLDETHHVAPGHKAQVLLRWGDPLFADSPAFNPLGQSVAAQKKQFGFDNDYIGFMPLPRGSNASDHGLLCINHEAAWGQLMFPGFTRETGKSLPADLCEIQMAAHGHTIVEVRRASGTWSVVQDSSYNRRITTYDTPTAMTGPAAGHARLKTRDDSTGRNVVGMVGNCAGGETFWGTILTAEENIHQYFRGDPRGGPEERNHLDMGMMTEQNYGWGEHFARFNLEREPNEPNRFGWMVEIDPYDPAMTPKKRTALGRFKHEGAGFALARDGRVVVYSGDDEVFQHVYKFVSRKPLASDPNANRDILDDGDLYAARFNADGTLDWLALTWGTGPLTAENGFNCQADVLIESRRAARLLGATPMDRPEEVVPNPVTQTVFVALTNNKRRRADQVDAANPRAKNSHGHVLELLPPGLGTAEADHGAAQFRWRPFLAGGNPREPDSGAAYHVDISVDGWLSCPDNMTFDRRGRMWLGTDGGTDSGFADGIWAADVTGSGRALTRHFFRCPTGAEMTGPCFNPDNTAFFCSVQHPAEDAGSNFDTPSTRWPDFRPELPPRPSVVVLSRNDGGQIG
ncbi:MAG: PhoX family phosphatase [Rhodospirillaceae bacterium]|nr:PhoX family phosphatase [Rhodospirillaceae bacterium]